MADHTFFVHKERLGRTVDTEVNGGAAVSVHHGHVIGISEVIEPLQCGKALVTVVVAHDEDLFTGTL